MWTQFDDQDCKNSDWILKINVVNRMAKIHSNDNRKVSVDQINFNVAHNYFVYECKSANGI